MWVKKTWNKVPKNSETNKKKTFQLMKTKHVFVKINLSLTRKIRSHFWKEPWLSGQLP